MITDDHEDRVKWNARFAAETPGFVVHPIVAALLPHLRSGSRVLELAAGPSGSALALAAAGAEVTAVDVSDVALAQLAARAATQGLPLQTLQVDLAVWTPPRRFDLVLATRYWDATVFRRAATAVAPAGVLAWETFTLAERRYRPGFAEGFCLGPDQPAALLTDDFEVLAVHDLDDGASATRRLIARRR